MKAGHRKQRNHGRSASRIGGTGLVALLIFGMAGAASAGVEAREERQRHRIHGGFDDGSLTRGEAHRLRDEQVRIERAERRFRADDGVLGPHERQRLEHRQDRASAHIYRARHNDRARRTRPAQ